jgi:hypothetical protein
LKQNRTIKTKGKVAYLVEVTGIILEDVAVGVPGFWR